MEFQHLISSWLDVPGCIIYTCTDFDWQHKEHLTIKPLLSEFLKAFCFLSVLEEISSTVTKVWLQDKPVLGIGCRCVTSKCVGVHQLFFSGINLSIAISTSWPTPHSFIFCLGSYLPFYFHDTILHDAYKM